MTPTPYPDINALLLQLLNEVRAIFGSQFVGLYLYGSLSSGDFSPDTSDVDFLVVTKDEPSPDLVPQLETLHHRLAQSGSKWARKLEGSYISRAALRRYNSNDPPRPTLNEGKFYMDRHGSDWIIQRHVIREGGLAVAGPLPQTLIDPVPPDDVRRAVFEIMRDWWAPMIDDPSFLRSDEYHAFAVLTMCRALHALQTGEILSKPVAARWAKSVVEPQWRGLIDQALEWKPGTGWNDPGGTVGFIQMTWGHCRQLFNSP